MRLRIFTLIILFFSSVSLLVGQTTKCSKAQLREMIKKGLSNKEIVEECNKPEEEKKKGKQRILFLGDSITARGKIVSQLKQLYRTERYEYWNAGVEGYNTFQEVEFFKKHNQHINPDHVILIFTIPNDFEDTPVVFVDDIESNKWDYCRNFCDLSFSDFLIPVSNTFFFPFRIYALKLLCCVGLSLANTNLT